MTPSAVLPKGYMQDAAGRLVPAETVKAIDIERDKLVTEIVAKAKVLSNQIASFKAAVFGDIGAFVELSAEQYDTRVGGNKGNVTLMSFDGRYKVLRAISEHLRFDERLMAAKALIDECIHDWAKGSSPELQVLVNDAFQVDKAGNINTVRVLSLRRLDIADERWQLAMRAISESLQVIGSKTYLRIYERDGRGGYQPIALDVSSA